MKKYSIMKSLLIFTILFLFVGCETLDLDQLDNPSTADSSLLDPDYTFNYAQLKLAEFVNSTNDFTQQVTRQMAMTGGSTYDNAFSPTSFNENWSIAYNILNSVKMMEPKAQTNIGRYGYALGASKIIRCYVLMTLVDMYKDIPYDEMLEGNANLTPHYNDGAYVYKQILLELDDAVAVLGQATTHSDNFNDIYYDGIPKWISLANTLKLKMYNNSRMAAADLGMTTADIVTKMNAIISSGNYINDPSKDFALKYGTSRSLPNDRHPLYNDQYELGGGAYIGNYLMWAMSTEKGFSTDVNSIGAVNDPRLHFYFFKQEANPGSYNTDTFILPGRNRPSHFNDSQYASFYSATLTPYVVSNWTSTVATSVPSNGFWGRDHGDNSGIPKDADKRTVGGMYPIGGEIGKAKKVQTSGTAGLKGAGIMPIMLSSWVHFIKAEAILKLGISGDAKVEFLAGINESITKVTNFNNTYYNSTTQLLAPQRTAIANCVTSYPTFMTTKYDAATPDKKLELIIKEYYIAAWGNGIEPYNNYRRTGYPSNFQPTLQPVSGAYYYSALYPARAVNNNPNCPANDRTRRVFWDKANLTLN